MHAYLCAVVSICDVPRYVIWTQVNVGFVRAHDVGMLLGPRCLSREPEDLVVSRNLCGLCAFMMWPETKYYSRTKCTSDIVNAARPSISSNLAMKGLGPLIASLTSSRTYGPDIISQVVEARDLGGLGSRIQNHHFDHIDYVPLFWDDMETRNGMQLVCVATWGGVDACGCRVACHVAELLILSNQIRMALMLCPASVRCFAKKKNSN